MKINSRVIRAYLDKYALFESAISKFNEKEKILYNQVKGVLLSNFYDTSNAHNIAILLKTDPNPEDDFVNKVFYYGKILGQLDEPFIAQLFSPTYIYTQTEANSPYFWFRRNASGFKSLSPIAMPFLDIWHDALGRLKDQNTISLEDGSPDYVRAIKLYSELLEERVRQLEEELPLEEKLDD